MIFKNVSRVCSCTYAVYARQPLVVHSKIAVVVMVEGGKLEDESSVH